MLNLPPMVKENEEEQRLAQELATGSRKSFQEIFMRYYPKVRYFVLGLVKSEEDAEDLAQDIFAKLWTNRAAFAEVRNLGVYLFVLSRNMTYNYIEARQLRQEWLQEKPFDEEDGHSPYEDLIAKDLTLLVDLVVEGLPPQRKTIYKLSREAGLSNTEIAEKLGLQKKTVENHLNLALKELRKVLLLIPFLYLC